VYTVYESLSCELQQGLLQLVTVFYIIQEE